jgi:hypothetical protein
MAGDGGRVAPRHAARLGRALASRVRAAVATGGASVVVEAKLLLIAAALSALAFVVVLFGLIVVGGAAFAQSDSPGGGAVDCVPSAPGKVAIPARFLPIYERASTRFGLGDRGVWVLASVHQLETGFGDSDRRHVSSDGARGPMQFLPSSWRKGLGDGGMRIVVPPTATDAEGYATDGDGDGLADIDNVSDAIHAAARKLRADGAPGDWRRAVFGYNHADWYVKQVLDGADALEGSCVHAPAPPPGGPLGELPADPLQRITYLARWIESQRLHYCWGGGHAPKPGPSQSFSYCWRPGPVEGQSMKTYAAEEAGLDCSGSVRWLLVLMGYPDPGPLHSSEFATAYPSGPGSHVTIWSNDGHVYVTIDGRDWGTSDSNYAHGPGFGPQSHSGFAASHPPGL